MSSQPLPNSPPPLQPRAEGNRLPEILRLLREARYRKGVMILALVASCLLGGLYYAATPRIYRSQASLLILQTGADTLSVGMSGEQIARDFMPTYCSMFTSEKVLEDAIALLKPEHRVDFSDSPRNQWTKIVRDNLSVSSVRRANILNIVYRSKDPEAAAAVVDSLVTAYLAFTDELHKSTAREVLDILTKEKCKLEDQLRAKEAQLLETRSRAGELVIREGDQFLNAVVKRVISLNDALTEAHEARLEAQSQPAAIEAAIRKGEDLQQHALAMVDAVGREVLLQRLGLSTADSYTLSRVNEQLLRNLAKLQTELQLYGPAHSKVREIQEEIRVAEEFLRNRHRDELAQLRETSDRELGPVLSQMASQRLEQAIEYEKSLSASYEEAKRKAIELDRGMAELQILELDLNRLRRFYDVVLERMKDIDLGEENGMLRTAVLSRPEVPTGPIWPRLITVVLLCTVVGLGAGLAIVYVQDLLDDRFRSPEELRLQLGVPLLAVLQEFKPLPDSGVRALQAYVRPSASETEAFRTLRTTLSFAQGGVRSLVVSSSDSGDGKTTVAANLAVVYAQSGKRTLLIDGDMRRPGLTPLLDLKGSQGLSAVLRQEIPVAQAVMANLHSSVLENLDVLPSGPRPLNPTELLSGERFHELLAWAETAYDQILIDSPPAVVADAAIIGRQVDGVLVVVQPEKNPRRLIIRTAENLSALEIKVLGIVVNRLTSKNSDSYYGYGYGYGYGRDEDSPNGADDPQRFQRPIRRITRAAA